ncbi:MAG: succinate dehydrogenase/fumarate reductase flavoprotein subunit, partial [Candidatus Peregrinibacteria bacterium GW2011_GWE2_39_6]
QAASALTTDSAVPKVLLSKALRLRHMLIAQQWYLYAVARYLENGGGSRGSYLVVDASGEPAHTALAEYRINPEKTGLRNVVQVIAAGEDGELLERLDECRPVPAESFWFERVWSDYQSGAYLQPPKP